MDDVSLEPETRLFSMGRLSAPTVCALLKRQGIPEKGIRVLRECVQGHLSRRVSNKGGTVMSISASDRTGYIVRTEARTTEFAYRMQLEFDPKVLVYFEQPMTLGVSWKVEEKQGSGTKERPDFLVVEADSIYLTETRAIGRLRERLEKNAKRLQCSDDGKWSSEPSERAAAEYGFGYRIISSDQINQILTGNLSILEDYWHADSSAYPHDVLSAIVVMVRQRPGVTLKELSDAFGSIHFPLKLIADRLLFCDLCRCSLLRVEHARVFPDLVSATLGDQRAQGNLLDLPLSDRGPDLSEAAVDPDSPLHAYLTLDPNDLAIARKRLAVVKNPSLMASYEVSERSLRRYKVAVAAAVAKGGDELLALVPKYATNNAANSVDEHVFQLGYSVIDQRLLKAERCSVMTAYTEFTSLCEAEGFSSPTYSWFTRLYREYPLYLKTLRREGPRSAYRFKSPVKPKDVFLPGVYPLHAIAIDHTEVDMIVVDPTTKEPLKRVWLTACIDLFSGRVLAFYVSFESWLTFATSFVLRMVVRKFGRLPKHLFVDNGPEFRSEWFETFCTIHKITIHRRPPHHSRFGAMMERTFGTITGQVFTCLLGNTQNTKVARLCTKAVDPTKSARWTLDELYLLLGKYFDGVYDNEPVRGWGYSRLQKWQSSPIQDIPGKPVKYDAAFCILALPFNERSSGKIVAGRGIRVAELWYHHSVMFNGEYEGKSVPIRVDHSNASYIFAFIGGRWYTVYTTSQLIRCVDEGQVISFTLLKRVRDRILNGRRRVSVHRQEFIKLVREMQQDPEIRCERITHEAVARLNVSPHTDHLRSCAGKAMPPSTTNDLVTDAFGRSDAADVAQQPAGNSEATDNTPSMVDVEDAPLVEDE